MPSTLIRYRVFMASPSGLDNVRKLFLDTVDEYNRREALPRGVFYDVVRWEATLPGKGRAQGRINLEIQTCDHAVFFFRDRWGSAPDNSGTFSSGSEEEW